MGDYEDGYVSGKRQTAITLLRLALTELGEHAPQGTREILERQETLSALRQLCRDLGLSSDWDDRLHLADVVNKHIFHQLQEKLEGAKSP